MEVGISCLGASESRGTNTEVYTLGYWNSQWQHRESYTQIASLEATDYIDSMYCPCPRTRQSESTRLTRRPSLLCRFLHFHRRFLLQDPTQTIASHQRRSRRQPLQSQVLARAQLPAEVPSRLLYRTQLLTRSISLPLPLMATSVLHL